MASVTIKASRDGKDIYVINGVKFASAKPAYVEYKFRTITGSKKPFADIVRMSTGESVETDAAYVPQPTVNDEFTINQRFGFVENVVSMVSSGIQNSVIITGEGGLGKTFTVLNTLSKLGIRDINDIMPGEIVKPSKTMIQIKGFSTAKNLFRTLYENNGSNIVFDDCDSIMKDPIAINILKGALDSYDKRIITWGAESRMGDSDELPRTFEFTGRIIFISNMNQAKIDQAIRSRSILIDLAMTMDQKLDRMSTLAAADDFMPEYSIAVKTDAIALISELKSVAREISLRTLITVSKIRATAGADWKDLAKYVLCN